MAKNIVPAQYVLWVTNLKWIMEGANLCNGSLKPFYGGPLFYTCSAKHYCCTNILPGAEIINYYATTKGPRVIYKTVFFINLSFGEQKSCFQLCLSLNNHKK